ncbi:MAG TPA: GNAT family N-acetyltransferase [Rhizobiaceae bacterium]|nr:GNAT family N-acetyltransferase [Rhizobiaceae bacterium]
MVAEKEDAEDESLRIDIAELITERLVMRPPREADIPAMVELANNRRIAEMLARLPHPYTETDARNFIALVAGQPLSGAAFALTDKHTGAFIGGAGLNATPRGLELGYWIGEPYWSKGYATEAAHALVDLAFRATNIQVLHVSCRVINPASRRVIHKCGFQYAGQGMMDSAVAGKVPVERYRLDRKTWQSLRSWARL